MIPGGVSTRFTVAIPIVFAIAGVILRAIAAYHATGSTDAEVLVFDSLCRWDCAWYVAIAEHGYSPFPNENANNVGNWGFFPLYPGLVYLVTLVSSAGTLETASIVSILLTVASCLVVRTMMRLDGRTYVLFCAYFLAGPFSYHFATALTESLFVLLTCVAVGALHRRQYVLAGLASALLSATRIVGVFMVFATLIGIVQEYRQNGGGWLRLPAYLLNRPHLLLALVISPLGLFAYILFLSLRVGDGFAFSNVQRAFGRQVDWPWLHWWDAATYASTVSWWPTSAQWSALTVLIGLGLAMVMVARRQYGLALFCAIAVVLPVSSGMASIIRYTAALVPLVLAMISFLTRSSAVTACAVAVFLALCFLLTMQWIGSTLALV